MLEENLDQRPKKNQLLCLFRRRPTRIEPENVKNKDHEVLLDEKTKATPNKSTNKSPLNRLSGNFSFCCSANAISTLSPNEIDELPVVKPIMRLQANHQLDLELLNRDSNPNPDKQEIKHDINDVSNKRFSNNLCHESEIFGKENIKINIQKPLEESKSRFRNRYAPQVPTYAPQVLEDENNQEENFESDNTRLKALNQPTQHFSNPDLMRIHSIPIREKKSMSFDDGLHNSLTEFKQRPASADSLARQALMAAHLFHLIPTEKARQHNYSQGQLGANPLLGPHELKRALPENSLKIFVGTWNMNGQNPPSQLNDLVFPNKIDNVPDIIALGTQESCSERYEWEVLLQQTIGPSHCLFHSASLGTLHLAIFLRRDLIWYCSVPEDDSFSVRPGSHFRTKGAVGISFMIFGTSLLFITNHLTAHQQKVKERVHDVKRIIHSLDLPKNLNLRHKSKNVTTNFDIVFFSGDLNFRLSETRANLLHWLQNVSFPLPDHLPHGFMHTDQLTQALSDCAAFKGFHEASVITFPPTYKYNPGSSIFDTSNKQRTPAYTDRILYKFKTPSILRRQSGAPSHNLPVICLDYDSVNSIMSSDHKPVWALFQCTIRPGIDAIPLAAGLFNRDIYLEGMRRRLNSVDSGSSAVCSIQ